jgi:peptidoglycan/LPS O-acetylase OafA/YrhL
VLAILTVSRITGAQPGERWFSVVSAGMIIALVTNTEALARIAAHRWLRSIGAWSYAIYLTHPIVFDFWNRLLPAGRVGDYLSLALTCITDFPLCWLLHIWVEKPCIDIGRRITMHLDQSSRDIAPAVEPVRADNSAGDSQGTKCCSRPVAAHRLPP